MRPDDQEPTDALDELLAQSQPRQSWDVDAMWNRLRTDALSPDRPADAPAPRRAEPPHRVLPRRWLVAAGLLLMAGSATLLVTSRRTAAPVAATRVEYATVKGEVRELVLGDGTRVMLASESRLTVAPDFGQTDRNVSLVGEATFDVRHDAARPFRVRTHSAELVDLGTRFNVRAYDSTGIMTLAVIEGAVSVTRLGSTAPPAIVKPGSVAHLDSTHVAVAATADVASYFSWVSGSLSFQDQPLSEILRTLGHWFPLDVTADAALLDRRVTAEISTARPADVVPAIAAALGARVDTIGGQIHLRAGR